MSNKAILPGLAILSVVLVPQIAHSADHKPVVAVFDIDCGPRVKLPKPALDGMTEYISSRLTESGRYQIVPRDQIKQRLVQEKTGSYKKCYDQSCQIEIGKELAAEKTLAARIVKLGKHCTVSLTFYDLRKAATEKAATQNGGCGEDAVVDSLEKALVKLLGSPGKSVATVSESGTKAVVSKADFVWVHSKPAGIDFTKSEVTVAQYGACVEAGKCELAHFDDGTCVVFDGKKMVKGKLPEGFRGDSQPVVCVDWNQATAFCEWAGGRLPTGQEWYAEASKGGKPWGDEQVSCDYAVMDQGGLGCGRSSTWPVCSKPLGNSISGLCDMSGNVWEWTSSWYDSSQKKRDLRGGSLIDRGPDGLGASNRGGGNPTDRNCALGFRCGRSVTP